MGRLVAAFAMLALGCQLSISLLAGAVPDQPSAPATRPSNGVVALPAKPILAYEHRRTDQVPQVYGPWAGLIEVTITNRSKSVVRLAEISPMAEFEVKIRDSSGEAVPLTELGKRAATSSRKYPGAVSVAVFDLVPSEERTVLLDVSTHYEITPGRGYRITLRRSRGLPAVDEDGKPLKNIEVSYYLGVPDYGILR